MITKSSQEMIFRECVSIATINCQTHDAPASTVMTGKCAKFRNSSLNLGIN